MITYTRIVEDTPTYGCTSYTVTVDGTSVGIITHRPLRSVDGGPFRLATNVWNIDEAARGARFPHDRYESRDDAASALINAVRQATTEDGTLTAEERHVVALAATEGPVDFAAFGISPIRYAQVLSRLLQDPRAFAYDPAAMLRARRRADRLRDRRAPRRDTLGIA